MIEKKFDKDNFKLFRKVINGIDVFFTDYYDKNNRIKNENDVYRFKAGEDTEYYIDLFSTAIEKMFYCNSKFDKEKVKKFLENVVIIPVPSSNILIHKNRYEKLFDGIAKRTGVINGYDFIKVSRDKECRHNNRTSEDYYNYYVKYSYLKKPYKVILIEDIVTSGNTIRKLRNKIFDPREYQKKMKCITESGLFCVCLSLNINSHHIGSADIKEVNENNGIFKVEESKIYFNIISAVFAKRYINREFRFIIKYSNDIDEFWYSS